MNILPRLLRTSTTKVLKIAAYSNRSYTYINTCPFGADRLRKVLVAKSSQVCKYSQECKEQELISVDYDYVKKAVNNTKTLIIDVREPEELKEHGYIPSSINIPLENVPDALNMRQNDFEKVFKRPKPSEDTEIIFYCMIGKRSGRAQQNALSLGYKNVKNYVGSWTDWATKNK